MHPFEAMLLQFLGTMLAVTLVIMEIMLDLLCIVVDRVVLGLELLYHTVETNWIQLM